MKNRDYYTGYRERSSAFEKFCSKFSNPEFHADCTGCPFYSVSRGANSCYRSWLDMQADEPTKMEVRPWTFNEAAALIGKNLEYCHPNHVHALYAILGVYQAQNGKTMVMIAGDAISTDTLLHNARYTFDGKRCGTEVQGCTGKAVAV